MKKLLRTAIAAMVVLCSVCAMALPVAASSTPDNAAPAVASTAENASPAVSASSSSAKAEQDAVKAPDVSGSYRTSIEKTLEKLDATAFLAPTVYVDPVTHAISNVYDADGNLIPATLSTDKHWYIVPTNEGNILIATGY